MERIINTLRVIGTASFWLTTFFVTSLFTYLGFQLSQKAIELGVVEKYKALDPFVKQFISIEDWWLETLLGGCIPMFILFGLQFFLLRRNRRAREYLYSVLPFLPKLSWLAGKPVYFMLATSSIFLGAIMFLGCKGDSKYYWGLIIPFSLFGFTFLTLIGFSVNEKRRCSPGGSPLTMVKLFPFCCKFPLTLNN